MPDAHRREAPRLSRCKRHQAAPRRSPTHHPEPGDRRPPRPRSPHRIKRKAIKVVDGERQWWRASSPSSSARCRRDKGPKRRSGPGMGVPRMRRGRIGLVAGETSAAGPRRMTNLEARPGRAFGRHQHDRPRRRGPLRAANKLTRSISTAKSASPIIAKARPRRYRRARQQHVAEGQRERCRRRVFLGRMIEREARDQRRTARSAKNAIPATIPMCRPADHQDCWH